MPLSTGTRLGPYEIIASIGAGGMGEVYRARDPRIGRDVAIKVLPATYAADPDRLRRFEQESRTAGMLNHPNILAIFDIGTHEGFPYVVSELLEGETLRARISDGLTSRKALDYAVQIAKGLAAAHEKGIVHRDLKPENLFVTQDGRVKILDFGLAKLKAPSNASNIETEVQALDAMTEPGIIVGTIGYMSPEQVRGRPVDHRSDIFSFGAVLYEMLTGVQPFRAESAVETMNAILKQEPADLSAMNSNLSAALERTVRHCLEKSPEERFQSARDLAFDLEALPGLSAPVAVSAPPVSKSGFDRRLLWAVLPVVLIAVAAAAYFAGRRAGERPLPSYQQLTFRRGTIQGARFSPDGRTIVYGAAWDGKPIELFATRAEGPESRPMGSPATGIFSISKSGEMALCLGCGSPASFGVRGTLARAPLEGGAPRELMEQVHEADWDPEGKDLAVARGIGIGTDRLEYPPGKVLVELGGWISHPRFSPRGDLIAYIEHSRLADDGLIAVVDLAGRKRTLTGMYTSAQGLAWSPDGNEVWFTAAGAGGSHAIYAAGLSGSGAQNARLVARAPGAFTLQDISRDGRTLLTHERARMAMQGMAAGGSKEQDLSWLDWSVARGVSDDGSVVLFDETGEASRGKYGVYIRRMDGSPAVRLGDGMGVSLSPDGKWALAESVAPAPQLVLLPTRAGNPRPLNLGSIARQWRAGWSPDGRQVVLAAEEQGRPRRTYAIDIETEALRPLTPEGIAGLLISPDGEWILAVDLDWNALMYRLHGGSQRPLPGFNAREMIPLRWGPDSRSFYFREFGDAPASIFKFDPARGRKEVWKQLMPADPAGIRSIGAIWLSADLKSYVYSYTRVLSDLYLVDGLR